MHKIILKYWTLSVFDEKISTTLGFIEFKPSYFKGTWEFPQVLDIEKYASVTSLLLGYLNVQILEYIDDTKHSRQWILQLKLLICNLVEQNQQILVQDWVVYGLKLAEYIQPWIQNFISTLTIEIFSNLSSKKNQYLYDCL